MLLDLATYRRLTGDTVTADDVVTQALGEAQSRVEQYLRRELESLQRTEVLRMYPDTRCYVSAPPVSALIDPAQGIISEDRHSVRSVGGVFVRGEWIYGTMWTDPYPRVSVTYVGGWALADAPVQILRGIASIARLGVALAPVSAAPAGATMLRVGDVQVQYARPIEADQVEQQTLSVLRSLDGWRLTTQR